MKKEICYGIIPLIFQENGWRVLIVQHLKGNYWGFPKGHAKKGESPKESAERELKEETSLRVIRYLPHPHLTELYQFRRNGTLIEKTVHFYLAEVNSECQIDSLEIIRGRWITVKNLLSYVTFKEEEKLFKEVIALLS